MKLRQINVRRTKRRCPYKRSEQCAIKGNFRRFSIKRRHSSGLQMVLSCIYSGREETFSNYQLNAQFLYSSTICMLHYDPQHVSSSTLLILRSTNCITTASGIVNLCKQPYSMQVYSGLSAFHLHIVRLFTEGDDTRGCGDTICPPEDKQRAARNMLRIVA